MCNRELIMKCSLSDEFMREIEDDECDRLSDEWPNEEDFDDGE